MIRAILFDFDGVLTTDKTGSQSILSYLSRHVPVPLDLLKTEYYKFNRQLLYGELTHEDIWPEFTRRCGYPIDYSLLIQSFRATPLDQEMLNLARELHPSHQIAMITDNKYDRISEILEYHALKPLFDVVSVSAQYHSGKNEAAIFEGTLAALNALPEECIFIDNSEKNLIMPQKLGMHALFFDDAKRDIAALRAAIQQLL